MDAYPIILTSLAVPRLSALQEVYKNILPQELTFVKHLFVEDKTLTHIQSILDNSYFSLQTQQQSAIIQYLYNLKIFDPACGSGAFPMGVLQKLTDTLHTLQPDKTVYDIKKKLLANCIYGSDIMPIAVEISRLRCWLSLIVDQPAPPISPNELLPNLEFKFVCANSLIGNNLVRSLTSCNYSTNDLTMLNTKDLFGNNISERDDLFEGSNNQESTNALQSLQAIIKENFSPNGKSKSKIISKYKDIKDQIFNALLHNPSPELLSIMDYNHFSNQPSGFFDSEWMFGVKEFDIVIGNPPYVGEKGNKDTFEPLKTSILGKRFYKGKMDLFYFFFHLGIDILRPNGILSYITTNYYITATGGLRLRDDFQARTDMLELINFGELKVFESALGQHNLITTLQKKSTDCNIDQECNTTVVRAKGYLGQTILDEIITKRNKDSDYHKIPQSQLYKGGNIQLTSGGLDNILDKLLTNSKPLGEICDVNQGILSGADKVSDKHIKNFPELEIKKNDGIFVVDKNQFLNISHLKPWYKNSHITKFASNNTSNERLILADKNCSEDIPKILMEHLLKLKPILDASTDNSPYLHRPRGNFFELPKIVAPQRSKTNTFGYNDIPWYASADVYFITKPKEGYKLKFLLGVLNSKLLYKWLYNRGKRKGDMLELYQEPLSNLPIPILDTERKQSLARQIESIVDQILDAKKVGDDTAELESQIDELVYQLYELTSEEIALIVSSARQSI